MKRNGKVTVTTFVNLDDSYPDYYLRYYNRVIYTNKTIKKPIGCPNGK